MNQTVPSRKHWLAQLTALLLWSGCLLWLSLTPNPPSPPSALLSWDKLQHAGAYALLTLLVGSCFRHWRPLGRHPWLFAWAAAVAFGGLVEILQGTLTDVRQAEWGDLLADAVGGFLAATAAAVRDFRQRRKATSS